MQESIRIMTDRITAILAGNDPSIYLFGSVVLDDFKLGFSDIDLICLTERSLFQEQAQALVGLRQTLLNEFPGNPYFRSFEGGLLSWNALLNKTRDVIVYWGTSGQRITDQYVFDSFSTITLLDHGRLLFGTDKRERLWRPGREVLLQAVASHYRTIRLHACETGESLYSAGWLLDIARCLYTVQFNDIIAKTRAGYWALENGLVPEPEVMKKALFIRENPLAAKADKQTLVWLTSLGPHIQRFADVLENRLKGNSGSTKQP